MKRNYTTWDLHENANTLRLRDDVIQHAVASDWFQMEFAWSSEL